MMDTRTILLVEDNRDDEELALRAFARGNIADSVHVVRDGAEAVDYLFGTGTYAGRDTAELPAVVFLDLKLPKINGLEVLRRLREHDSTRFMPVVILTSSGEARDIADGYRLGANSYITKPIDYETFIETVKVVGLYWFLFNKPLPITGRN